jgi:predicted extracellular nuclease
MQNYWSIYAIMLVAVLWMNQSPVAMFLSHYFQSPEPGLLLTEVYYDTPGRDENEEWIELANLGSDVLMLTDFKLGDEESMGGGEGMVRFPEDARMAPGEIIIVAQTATGFRQLFDIDPTYEIQESDKNVPNLVRYSDWSDGDIQLSNDGDEILVLDDEDRLIDAIVYGDSTTIITGAFSLPSISDASGGQSIQRVPADCDTNTAGEWQPGRYPSPGQISFEGVCQAPSLISNLHLIPIGQIQGEGTVAAAINQEVAFRGIVTGVLEDENAAGIRFYTIFVQELMENADGDPNTSDGIAVFAGRQVPSVAIGDIVHIRGKVTEFFGLTEIDNDGLDIVVESRNNRLPPPVLLDPPQDSKVSDTYFERFEGLLVYVNEAKVIGPTHIGCGFATVQADIEDDRVFRRAAGDSTGNVINVLNYSDVDCSSLPSLHVGDRVGGVSGPLTYHFDQFKIVQQKPSDLTIAAPGLPVIGRLPQLGPSQVSIATFNLDNFFNLIDDTGNDAEPKPTEEELATKQAKLRYAITEHLMCPTFLAVQEVENKTLLIEIAETLANKCGWTYEVTHRESPDSRGIDLALLSNKNLVTILESRLNQTCSITNTAVLDSSIECPVGNRPLFSRPPLRIDTQVFGQSLTLFVNHFKSKRGGATETESQRLAQAEHLLNLTNEILAENPMANIVVLGDFNDFEDSPVMKKLTEESGLINAIKQVHEQSRYSYIFDGESQLLDTILLSKGLNNDLAYANILHANANFAHTLANDTSANGLPYRSSDHDIPIVYINLNRDEQQANQSSSTELEPVNTLIPVPSISISVTPTTGLDETANRIELTPLLILVGAGTIVGIYLIYRRG